MKVFRGLPNSQSRAPCALTIGNFDGVHRGHQALLAEVREAAARLGTESAVMTFEPHPREFFAQANGRPETAPARIANLRDKLQSLSDAGIDRVVVEHFNARFAALSPHEFVDDVLVGGLHVKWLMVGEDFRFGAKRAGDIDMLVDAGKRHGFTVRTLPTIAENGLRISSSAIRAALAAGDLLHAKQLLGHAYAISGHVIHGAKLGRNLGFPTMNLRVAHKRPALSGIFVVQVHGLTDGPLPLPGVASLGVRPTVDDNGRVLLETFVFDYSGNAYGKLIRVEFLHNLRDSEKHADRPPRTAAIHADADQARAWFKARDRVAISATDRI